ncbi:MAG: type I 3-dehydroquinate dehydratase [Syntrophobacteraceae bacterium]|jgi:3-dehydroquinate dehydratase type I|nr:type I 3-dehydroquinate dehydratase [Syntrophobacteraceae bacterium]
MGTSGEELATALNLRGLTLLEWRLDVFLTSRSTEEALQALELLGESRRLPVLVTNRPVREGGLFAGTEEDRVGILLKAAEAGADWVDLELDVPLETVSRFREVGTRVLISHHDFSRTPEDGVLRKWIGAMAAIDPQALKLVTHAQSPGDCLRILGLIPWARHELDRSLIAFCMGPLGSWSRLACLVLGSPWTYVQIPGQAAAAPGQLSLDDAEQLWRLFSSGPMAGGRPGLKHMERQLQQADRLASIGQLASGIAHEINNPLGLILGYTQLLLRDELEGSERLEDLKIIEKHARACKTVVRDLLNFARSAPSRKGPGHLHTCIREILGVVRHPFELDGVRIETELDDSMPTMELDEARIRQVFMNLIMNAKQAIKDKGIIGVVTRFDPKAGVGLLEVRDSGCGIPPEHLSRIFDPFFTTKEPGEGTGLGLSVSYGIVRDHGGEISVESEPGKGSSFTVMLPVIEERQGAE